MYADVFCATASIFEDFSEISQTWRAKLTNKIGRRIPRQSCLNSFCGSDTEDGIIEARVSHRKSSQQHIQAGPKKYTKIANELKNHRAPPSAAPHRGRRFAPPPVVLFFNSFAICVYFLGPACVCCWLLFLCGTLASIIPSSVTMMLSPAAIGNLKTALCMPAAI